MFLEPTIYVGSYLEITPELLNKYNIKGLLTDLDDTIVTHGNLCVDENADRWFKEMKTAGIPVCIISNNNEQRVKPFAEKVGVPFFPNANKPSSKFIEPACEMLGVNRSDVAFMGDQLFTDIGAAKNGKIKSILVEPVGTKATVWIAIKRIGEKILKRNFRRLDTNEQH